MCHKEGPSGASLKRARLYFTSPWHDPLRDFPRQWQTARLLPLVTADSGLGAPRALEPRAARARATRRLHEATLAVASECEAAALAASECEAAPLAAAGSRSRSRSGCAPRTSTPPSSSEALAPLDVMEAVPIVVMECAAAAKLLAAVGSRSRSGSRGCSSRSGSARRTSTRTILVEAVEAPATAVAPTVLASTGALRPGSVPNAQQSRGSAPSAAPSRGSEAAARAPPAWWSAPNTPRSLALCLEVRCSSRACTHATQHVTRLLLRKAT